jgi:hypothetical protein
MPNDRRTINWQEGASLVEQGSTRLGGSQAAQCLSRVQGNSDTGKSAAEWCTFGGGS